MRAAIANRDCPTHRAPNKTGVIEGYQARIGRKALGLTIMAVVQLSLKSQNEGCSRLSRRPSLRRRRYVVPDDVG